MAFHRFNKEHKLLLILGGLFICNALLAEFIGVKIFSLEKTFGFDPVNIRIFGQDALSFNLTAGVVIWPVVFIMTDIINEYFGTKSVKFLSWLTVILILYSFFIIQISIHVVPADFWPTSHLSNPQNAAFGDDVKNLNAAFSLIFGQGSYIIIGSVLAFLISQMLDVTIFHQIKKRTGEKWIWLRATGSTVISQLIDSFVVLFIAFYIGAGWSLKLVLAICIVNYVYKFLIAILITPILYLIHYWVEKFLGKDLAIKLKQEALAQ